MSTRNFISTILDLTCLSLKSNKVKNWAPVYINGSNTENLVSYWPPDDNYRVEKAIAVEESAHLGRTQRHPHGSGPSRK